MTARSGPRSRHEIGWVPRLLYFAAGAVAALATIACSSGAEESVLRQFFAASRLHDRTALQNFATAEFPPHQQGIVTTFEIVSVGPERVASVDLKGSERQGESSGAVVRLSVDNPQQPVDLTTYAVQLVSKDMTIQASVRLPDGSAADKTLVVTMQRARLSGDRRIEGRWIVTALTQAPDARTSRAASSRRPR